LVLLYPVLQSTYSCDEIALSYVLPTVSLEYHYLTLSGIPFWIADLKGLSGHSRLLWK
jgi:hypothetical protein